MLAILKVLFSAPRPNTIWNQNPAYITESLLFRLFPTPPQIHNAPPLTSDFAHILRTESRTGDDVGSITKHPRGWRAYITKQGIRKSKLLKSKTAARDWIAQTESEILDGQHRVTHKKSVSDLLTLYAKQVSPEHKGEKWEVDRINLIKRDPLADIMLKDISKKHIQEWRDRRKSKVSDGSVLRERNLLSAIFTYAKDEAHWIEKHPMKGVSWPSQPKARERRITDEEIELIKHTTGYVDCPVTKSSRVGAAFLFSIETAMRASEVASVRPENVDLDKRTAFLPETKNGTSRYVPLSAEAVRILKQVDCDFKLRSDQISSLFRKSKDMCGIKNLHYHDTRHEAITRLAGKMDVLDLARMVGMKDLKTLLVYYNKSAEDIAKQLD